MPPEPYRIDVPQADLDDLRDRLLRTRWIDAPDDGWAHGASPAYLRTLMGYWARRFDWREQEAALNQWPQFRAVVNGVGIHFIHVRGVGPRPLPLVLTHGFPDSFVRFLKIVPLLADPAAHGGDPADAFDVVVPSLPGYAFSDPLEAGATFGIGDLWHGLMTRVLGYPRFAAHGGDWGSTITEQVARSHGGAVIGIHLTDVPFWHAFRKPDDASAAEQAFFERNEAWIRQEGAYALIQGTRPLSLAPGLADSPVGLAAWMVEKFQRWSDCGGDLESRFSRDELLTNLTIYWVTKTIGSSFQPYVDFTTSGAVRWMIEGFKQWVGSKAVPAAFALFPKDLSQPPREWAARFFDVRRWTEMPRGGHFAAMEEPGLLVEDLRAFFRPLRAAGATEPNVARA